MIGVPVTGKRIYNLIIWYNYNKVYDQQKKTCRNYYI